MVLLWALVAAPWPEPARASEYDEELARIGAELAQCMAQRGRKRVAAVDFTDLQMNVSELGRLIAEELSTELVRQAPGPGYAVIDRNHLQVILREHELSANGLVNPENSKKLGQFAGIDTLITGNVFELESSIRVTVKAMDTESASIVCASRGDLPKTMALREIAATATSGALPRPSASTAVATPESPNSPPEYQDEMVRVTVDSVTKTRTGDRVEIVIRITNVSTDVLQMALYADSTPALSDDVGTDWRFGRCSGIDRRSVTFDAVDWPQEEPQSALPRGAYLLISCSFAGQSSAGTRFSFTSSLVARPYRTDGSGRRRSAGRLFLISVGLSDIRTR